MGPVNWLAVVLAAALAVGLGLLWYGPIFPITRNLNSNRSRGGGNLLVVVPVMLLGAAMLGHSFARIGVETLDAKPWLYFMQTGGIALAFIVPTTLVTHMRMGSEPYRRIVDCGFWIVAYLAMGVVFWALG